MSKIDFEHIKTDMVNDVAVVQVLSRELRFPPQCKELGDELALVAGQDWAKKLLVNLRHTKYLCSTGFAILFNLVKQARQQGSLVKFCEMDPEVRIGADIIGLDKMAEIHDSEDSAFKSFELE